jgi:hypothetical protein
MIKGDEYYGESVEGYSDKAIYKIANLMAHGYELDKPEKVTLLSRNNDAIIVMANGDVYKKAIY